MGELIGSLVGVGGIGLVVIIIGLAIIAVRSYRKVDQGQALIIIGPSKTAVKFTAGIVWPFIEKAETMDISVKRIEISRQGTEGLICRDNMRADIKVVFFVRVNNQPDDVRNVAQSLGCERASSQKTLEELFDAKFSEALKTVGKKMDFVDLYNSRDAFKNSIIETIGRDLDGYVINDVAIDYLEQTSIKNLDPANILDSEGIKKITELTAIQRMAANQIERDRDKTIKKQDVEAREQILELERQQTEAEEQQKREIAATKAREAAATMEVQQEERRKAEQARIAAEEEVQIAEENKQRQVIVAQLNKTRTESVEKERIEKDRALEANERERVVELARIEKERALEEERKNIQEIIRDRVTVQRGVVEEEEKIKDTQVRAEAERKKIVQITEASATAEEAAIKEIKAAEALKETAGLIAEKLVVEAEAKRKAVDLESEARKRSAEAKAAEDATIGLAEAEVMEAKARAAEQQGMIEAKLALEQANAEAKGVEVRAEAHKKKGLAEAEVLQAQGNAQAGVRQAQGNAEAGVLKAKGEAEAEALQAQGTAEASILQTKGNAEATVLAQKAKAEAMSIEHRAKAEATGIELRAEAAQKAGTAEASVIGTKGEAEANVMERKYSAEAMGITKKAEAMRALDGAGREHEEFKLKLETQKIIELARINIQKDISAAQAEVLSEALKSANIDIVGGDAAFIDRITAAVTSGKAVDRMVGDSEVLGDIKDTFFNGDPEYFKAQLRKFVDQFGMSSADLRNLTLSALISKLMSQSKDSATQGMLSQGLALVEKLGMGDASADIINR